MDYIRGSGVIYAPGRSIWTPPRVVPLLRNLTPDEWDQNTRPWHKAPNWRPGRSWFPGREGERRMHDLGITGYQCQPAGVITHRRSLKPASGINITAPFSFWPMSEASGSRADTGPNGNTLVLGSGNPSSATGHIGSAA